MKILLLLLFQTLIFGLLNIQELDAGLFKSFFGNFTKCFKPAGKNGKTEKTKVEKHKSIGDFLTKKEEEEHERKLLEKKSRVVDIPTFSCEHGKELKKQILINYKAKEFKINFDFENQIGEGAYSQIYHAYMEEETSSLEIQTSLPSSKNLGKCVALKISKYTTEEEKLSVDRELKILEYFADIPQNVIIGMHAHDTVTEEYYYSYKSNEIYSEKYIILELGGVDLLKFYNEQPKRGDQLDLVTKIAKGAAKALSQFNEHAIHLDVKPTNFLVHSQNEDEIVFKLIDFNTSFLIEDMKKENIININLARKFKPPEIRENFKLSEKIDPWQFGIMIYELLYKRDGVIKTPTYSPLTKSPLSSFKYPSPSPKYSHKSPSIQGSTSEIIETYSASIFNYDYFDSQLNNYRMDKSKNSLVDRVIKKCIQHEENRRSKMSEIVELFNQKGKKQLEDDKGEEISYFLD